MTTNSALPPLESGVTLTAIGVDNLRALRMEEPVELRRLMLLVGRNGIGKSTFARVFPLLRQSADYGKREPLLWWERDEVDFGTFQEAVRRGSSTLTFQFEFTQEDGIAWMVSSTLGAASNGPNGSRVHRANLQRGEDWLTIYYDQARTPTKIEGRTSGKAFTADRADAGSWTPSSLVGDRGALFGLPRNYRKARAELRKLLDILYPNAFEGVSRLQRRALSSVLPWTTINEPESLIHRAVHRRQGRSESYQDQNVEELRAEEARLRHILQDPERDQLIRRINFCLWALRRLSRTEDLVEEVAVRTAYIGPFRATPERTYRPQSVSVEELDPSGANLAMFLSALTEEERADLNTYLRQDLGFGIHTTQVGGHYSLELELEDSRHNLLDTGFGYSQMLPVAVQLWASSRPLSTGRERHEQTDSIIVIEQPELHLHPHQQVRMARTLGAFAANDHGPVQIIETHSDYLVSEIGMLVARGQLSPERVGVLCFEPHPDVGTAVRMATFDDEGRLQNWPVGFLAP
ncbi:MAG: AAA family ATPase [Myxococcota bacterium]